MKKIIMGVFIVLVTAAFSHARGISIIANNSFSKNSLTIPQLKDVYLGKTEVVDGVRIQPIDQKEETIKQDFLKKIMDMSADDYRSYWIRRVFREGGTPPSSKGSPEDVIKAVKDGKGSIGYVRDDDIKSKEGIKVLMTISVP